MTLSTTLRRRRSLRARNTDEKLLVAISLTME